MGKGSSPRPYSVTQEEFGNRYDAIFGNKKKLNPEPQDQQPAAESNDSTEQESKQEWALNNYG